MINHPLSPNPSLFKVCLWWFTLGSIIVIARCPSAASAPSNLKLVIKNDSPNSILLTWTPPSPLGDTTGYRISFTGGSSGSVNVSGGSTDHFTLTRLRSGEMYNISIVGTSEHFFSESVAWDPVMLPSNKGTLLQILKYELRCYIYEAAVSGGEEQKDSGGGAVRTNDEDYTDAIVAGMVTPFIFLVTVFAVILVCWRWYAHP